MTRQGLRRGKDAERAVAKLLNGKRTGHLGGADVETDLFAVEVKEHKGEPPAWIKGAVDQALRNSKRPLGTDALPLVVHEWHLGQGRPVYRIFMMPEAAWLDLHGDMISQTIENGGSDDAQVS